ncbi:MAG TPA: hypothetical protein VD840_09100, partial [Sinorhizobium sp.]|nr:hypothetical protein [Sinorhizobium sp.]
RSWAEQLGHVGSMAHAYDIEAMLHHHRRDFEALRAVIGKMRRLTLGNDFPALAAKAQIFEGWCIGNTTDPARGRELFEQGLAIHREIETLEDFPVYCDMLAELHALTGDCEAGLRLLSDAVADAERTGQRYWLAELHHRRARLLLQMGAGADAAAEAFARSLAIASEQNAAALLLAAYNTLAESGVSGELVAAYGPHARRAMAQFEEASEMPIALESIAAHELHDPV